MKNDLDEAFQKGLELGWKAAKFIVTEPIPRIGGLFGEDASPYTIFRDYTVSQALISLSACEEFKDVAKGCYFTTDHCLHIF